MGSHSVTCHATQVIVSCFNLDQTGRYSIHLLNAVLLSLLLTVMIYVIFFIVRIMVCVFTDGPVVTRL